MNEKRNVLFLKIDAAQEKPAPIKITPIRPLSAIKQHGDAFAVDWQLEESGTFPVNTFSARKHKISFVLPQLKPNK